MSFFKNCQCCSKEINSYDYSFCDKCLRYFLKCQMCKKEITKGQDKLGFCAKCYQMVGMKKEIEKAEKEFNDLVLAVYFFFDRLDLDVEITKNNMIESIERLAKEFKELKENA